jgi:hypothetical protein
MFRFNGRQRQIARAVVRQSRNWPAWAAKHGVVSRQLRTSELNQAIKDLNLRLEVFIALRSAGLLPIWDRDAQGWVPVIKPKPAAAPAPVTAPVVAQPVPDVQTLLTMLAEMEARFNARLKQIEIATGLRFADPEELSDVWMEKAHTLEQYAAFDANNPH